MPLQRKPINFMIRRVNFGVRHIVNSKSNTRNSKRVLCLKLKAENFELKENNVKLKEESQNVQNVSSSSSKDILKDYDYIFQKFLAKSIDRSKMASMIYGVSGNNRRGIGYETPKGKKHIT